MLINSEASFINTNSYKNTDGIGAWNQRSNTFVTSHSMGHFLCVVRR